MKNQRTQERISANKNAELVAIAINATKKAKGQLSAHNVNVVTFTDDCVYFMVMGCPLQFKAIHKTNLQGERYIVPESICINH